MGDRPRDAAETRDAGRAMRKAPGRRPPSGRGGARRRRLPFRAIGRNIVLFAAANAVVSLFLPWIGTSAGGVNAFRLRWAAGLYDPLNPLTRIGWVAAAAWFVLGAAVFAAVVMMVDRRRSLGPFAAFVPLAAGGWMILFAVHVFETLVVLRQVGVVACGLSGLFFVAGGALLLRARWERPPPRTEPLATRLRRLPWVTVTLVALTAAAHLVMVSLPGPARAAATRALGLTPASLRWYAPVTYMFVHGDWLHLFANAAVLAAVGAAAERRTGRATFLGTYVLSGLAGAFASVLVDPRIHMPLHGASGAVAGVMGLCLVVAPRARVSVWFHAGVAMGKVRLQVAWLFSAWLVIQAVDSFYLAIGEPGPVAHWAHLGGVAFGLAAGGLLTLLGDTGRDRAETPSSSPSSRAGRGGRAGLERARRRDRLAVGCLPHAVIAVSLLLSAVAVPLSFGSGSLMRQLARFQLAWNSGDVERVARLFPSRRREGLAARLRSFVGRLDPESPEGRTGYRVALTSAARYGDECHALFILAPAGVDPYRVPRRRARRSRSHDGAHLRPMGEEWGRTLRIELWREGGAWGVVAIGTDGRPPGRPSTTTLDSTTETRRARRTAKATADGRRCTFFKQPASNGPASTSVPLERAVLKNVHLRFQLPFSVSPW